MSYFLNELEDKFEALEHEISTPKPVENNIQMEIFLLKNPIQLSSKEPIAATFNINEEQSTLSISSKDTNFMNAFVLLQQHLKNEVERKFGQNTEIQPTIRFENDVCILNIKLVRYGKKVKINIVNLAFEKIRKDLFRDFVHQFYRIKLAASPWPIDIQSPDMQERYINEINQKMGVNMQVQDIQPNPGKRTMAKLLLNASYGKMGEQDHHKSC